MTFKDQLKFVRQNMKKNKMRIFMTVLATAMGCTFLIVLASVGFGLQETLVKDQLEQSLVTEIQIHGYEDKDGNYHEITDEEIEYIESIEGIKAVTRRIQLYQTPDYKIDNYQSNANTVVAHFPSELKAGLKLAEGNLPEAENEIVVGYNFEEYLTEKDADPEEIYDEQGTVKEAFRYSDSLIGKNIDMTVYQYIDGEEQSQTTSLKVVGILEKPTREWATDSNVYITEGTLSEIEEFTGTLRGSIQQDGEQVSEPDSDSDTYNTVNAYANNLEVVDSISTQLKDENYLTYSVADEVKQINMLFTIAKAGLIFIGTIAILIASIGIYNTMTMAVTERAPDIGIMKAIGANPKTIKQIFLLESSYIGFMGAIIGTIVAYIISFAVNIGLPLIIEMAFQEEVPEGLKFSSIPLSLVAISTGICLLVTIVSGSRPAKRATKIDVLKAMRREI
ncbi:ABC transporter permease [Aquibacillus rhizosphaerae]|uniref:ABC transporter permease n=1 Tax=Aquibacillus rhizosphaerae TaxID=3051431 RepID=A0ABT7L699_9BACI|nr:ABC transporter permease [Aquibacillus sp. LR5S19]MDL4840126.1 ABC transporter permease [Aquibacillus sp. LR5S19]